MRGDRGSPFQTRRTTIGRQPDRPIYLFSTDSPLRSTTGDVEGIALYAGEGAERILDIPSAVERLERIARDAASALSVATVPVAAKIELSSAVCHAAELDQAHADLATEEEVLRTLNEMLEAERAGARIAMDLPIQPKTRRSNQ